MTDIKIPDSFMGKSIKGAMDEILKEQEKQKNQPQNALNLDKFIFVPSINLYVQKEKQLHDKTWHQAHKELWKQGLRMPTIEEFRQFLSYLRYNPSAENTGIYKEIAEVSNHWSSEWLDAYFLNQGNEFYIFTQHESEVEKLEQCLMEDKPYEVVGIDIDEWLNDATKQGLPKSDIKMGKLGYWKPITGCVSGFYTSYFRASLDCRGSPDYSDSTIGVRGVLEGAGAKTK